MKRSPVSGKGALGLLLVLHGLAHVALGMEAQDAPLRGLSQYVPAGLRVAIATALFFVATPGFVAAGFGAWNVAGLRRIWFPLVKAAVLGSLLLLAFTAPSGLRLVIAIGLDAFVLALSDVISADPELSHRKVSP